MPPTIDAQIRARIAEFAEELSSLVKQVAVETVQDALGGAGTPTRRRGPGRPRKASAARRKPGRRPGRPRATKAVTRAGRRIRRSAEDLEALAGKVLAYVKANAGHRLEQISTGLKIASKELKRPVATLLESKKLRTKGQKRGTRYFAGGKSVALKTRKTAGKQRKSAKKATRKVGKKAKRGGRKKAVQASASSAAAPTAA